MSIVKIILFTILANVVCGNFISSTPNNINVSQYGGQWYIVAFTRSKLGTGDDIRCYSMNVTILNAADQRFKQDIKLLVNGVSYKYSGFGKIVNSDIRFWIGSFGTLAGTVTGYNHGDELIFHDEMDPSYYHLLSRWPDASADTKAEFEKIASGIDADAVYVGHSKCTY